MTKLRISRDEPPYTPFAGVVEGQWGEGCGVIYYGPWCDIQTKTHALVELEKLCVREHIKQVSDTRQRPATG